MYKYYIKTKRCRRRTNRSILAVTLKINIEKNSNSSNVNCSKLFVSPPHSFMCLHCFSFFSVLKQNFVFLQCVNQLIYYRSCNGQVGDAEAWWSVRRTAAVLLAWHFFPLLLLVLMCTLGRLAIGAVGLTTTSLIKSSLRKLLLLHSFPTLLFMFKKNHMSSFLLFISWEISFHFTLDKKLPFYAIFFMLKTFLRLHTLTLFCYFFFTPTEYLSFFF